MTDKQIIIDENIQLKKKLREIKNVLSINFDLWMYYIANGLNNSSNENISDLLEDLGVSVRLLADTLGESGGVLHYYTNGSKIYETRKELLKKMNEVCNDR